MKRFLKKIKKYLTNTFIRATFMYTKYYENTKIKEEILIQSYDGSSISGNPYYLLLELCRNEDYVNLKKIVAANKENINKIKNIVKSQKLLNTEVIKIHSRKYCNKLAEAKYLINNSTFPTYFMKKEGQVYINTWHGTPLKAMGRDIIDSPHELGNTQRNFIMADYLLFQNDFMFEKMKNAYMLDNLYLNKYIISGYPRNDIFFDKEDRKKIKKELNIEGKKVIVYMPTWRGTASKKQNEKQTIEITNMLEILEKNLNNDTILYIKIHNLANAKIDYNNYQNIKPFPTNYETYRFLNIADCLITDYSSVMFDFANTGKKIILYTYDYEEYTNNRGFYLNVKDMPFTVVYDEKTLCKEINKLDNYLDYTEFKNEFCGYDSKETSKKICDLFLKNNPSDLKIINGKDINNQKKNILIFTGALLKNGITSSLKGLINNIDLKQYNYYLTFFRNHVRRNCYVINSFPKDCNYIPIQGQKNYEITEFIAVLLYYKLNIETTWIRKKLEKVYKREINRIYPNIKFDTVIDFSGYDRQPMNMFSYMNAQKIRYTHSNLIKEQKTRNNIHILSLKHAYRTYDKIAVVREGMKEEVQSHFKEISPKCIELVHNVNDIENIIANSKKEIELSDNTFTNYSKERIEDILNDKKKIKFINIGRFSKEKGQERLVRAFKKVQDKYKNAYLFLIGGHGKEFNNIMKIISEEDVKNVIVIKNLDNPYPILKKCNLFILSSYYEGLPMTVMESLILNVPILSVDIDGPRKFLEQGYAYLVENSEQGLQEGMNKFINKGYGNLKKFNAEEFNNNAIQEFYKLISK